MNIGFVGLGKLGLPCALAMEDAGHKVMGYDISEHIVDNIHKRHIPYREEGAQELLSKSRISLGSLDEVISHSQIVFCPIQTPHQKEYEGVTRIPDSRKDFDYSYLREGVSRIAESCQKKGKRIILVIISTVLPGTMEREIKPLLNEYIQLCYNPYFIAMGTTIQDFLHPEFVLLGCEDKSVVDTVRRFYATIHDRPMFVTDIKTAELVKVSYNTFIGLKIVFINAMMEICEKTGANVDDLSDALSLANQRLISPKYLRGGMGDGGGCHPRDNIAMSWLSQQLSLSHDIFSDMMIAREDQTEWLAGIIKWEAQEKQLPVYILGKAYKPETNLTVGSPSLLLSNILNEKGVHHTILDPFVDEDGFELFEPAVYFIGTKHAEFVYYQFPRGSVVIDPFGYMIDQEGVQVKRIGRP